MKTCYGNQLGYLMMDYYDLTIVLFHSTKYIATKYIYQSTISNKTLKFQDKI